jgi:hypothetical protein
MARTPKNERRVQLVINEYHGSTYVASESVSVYTETGIFDLMTDLCRHMVESLDLRPTNRFKRYGRWSFPPKSCKSDKTPSEPTSKEGSPS